MKYPQNRIHKNFNKLIPILALISLLSLTNASAFLLGGDGSSSFFNGTIDEFVIYNYFQKYPLT